METLSKREKKQIIVASIAVVICVVLLIYLNRLVEKQHNANEVYDTMIKRAYMEAGYVQGQAAAINGIIRVRPINDSTYIWLSSPWGTIKPVYDTVGVNLKYRK